jgi:hypothetical protein
MSENDFECYASAGVNTPETMSPSLRCSVCLGVPIEGWDPASAYIGWLPEGNVCETPGKGRSNDVELPKLSNKRCDTNPASVMSVPGFSPLA